jgi:hypothetical protein
MMTVEEVMDGHPASASDRDPTWDEAVAEFRTAERVKLVRPPRKVIICYRYEGRRFHATSPDLTGFEADAKSLPEIKTLVRKRLESYLDPAVELDEREPSSEELLYQMNQDRFIYRRKFSKPSAASLRDLLANGLRRVADVIESAQPSRSSKSSKHSIR